jgi:hypothetical protein
MEKERRRATKAAGSDSDNDDVKPDADIKFNADRTSPTIIIKQTPLPMMKQTTSDRRPQVGN